jgi:hypothetical protein
MATMRGALEIDGSSGAARRGDVETGNAAIPMTAAEQHLCRAKMEGDFPWQVDGSGKSA